MSNVRPLSTETNEIYLKLKGNNFDPVVISADKPDDLSI